MWRKQPYELVTTLDSSFFLEAAPVCKVFGANYQKQSAHFAVASGCSESCGFSPALLAILLLLLFLAR